MKFISTFLEWSRRSVWYNLMLLVLDSLIILLVILGGKITVEFVVFWGLILYLGCHGLIRALELRWEQTHD